MLPTFIIPGPPKAGTSSLQHYINGHPDIFMPEQEAHFFCDHYKEGLAFYDTFFEGWNGQKAIGEKTPCYFTMPEVPALIKKAIPDVKLLFIYRNPVDRAYSQYQHNKRRCVEADPFVVAIQKDIDSIPRKLDDRVLAILKREPSLLSYAEIGRYAEHIQRWNEQFDRSQMMHIVLETIDHSKLHDVLRFLGVNDDFAFGELKKFNVGGSPRSQRLAQATRRFENNKLFHDLFDRFLNFKRGKYPEMSQATRIWLERYFAPYNKTFEQMTGCSASLWSSKA